MMRSGSLSWSSPSSPRRRRPRYVTFIFLLASNSLHESAAASHPPSKPMTHHWKPHRAQHREANRNAFLTLPSMNNSYRPVRRNKARRSAQQTRRARVRIREVYAMNVGCPDGAATRHQASSTTANARGGIAVPGGDATVAMATKTTDSSNNDLQVPLGLPQMQPGEWLQLPITADAPPQPPPPRQIAANTKSKTTSMSTKKLDPFAVPDNEYNDSFLDSLWINLFASRMSAAVEAESFAPTVAREKRHAGAPTDLQMEQWPAAAAAAAAAVRARRLREDGGSGKGTAAVENEITVAKGGVDGFKAIAVAEREERNRKSSYLKSVTAINMDIEESVVDRIDPSPSVAFSGSGPGADSAAAAAYNGANGEHYHLPEGVGSTADGYGHRRKEVARQDTTGDSVSTTAMASGGVGRSVGGSRMRATYTYDDYVALATRLQEGPPERQRQVVRGVLRSIFPEWFPAFYRTLFPPSKFSAQVNAFMCPPLFTWLVGKSELMEGVVDLKAVGSMPARQEVWRSTVKVERCRYLEASKCKGTCMNLCKLPTEAFFREDLGMPLRMTPNFEDLSCEFAFGQAAAHVEDDPLMLEPCWTECLNSNKQPKHVPQRACHTMPESPLKGP